jgi:hypothetical protein
MGTHLNLVTCTIQEAGQKYLDDSKSLIETDNFREWYRELAPDTAHNVQSSDERKFIQEGLEKDKTELDALLRRTSVVAEAYRKKQALLCPVQRMPPEILLEIFKHLSPAVLGPKKTDPWKSMNLPEQDSFLDGALMVSHHYPRSPEYWEHPATRVCRQWRASFKTVFFTSKMVIDSSISPRRMASWLRNTGARLLDCEFRWDKKDTKSHSEAREKSRELLGHLSRIAVLSFEGTVSMTEPIFSRSPIHTASNLVSLTLAASASNASITPTSDLDKHPIASIEMPKLEFLRIKPHFHPLYLRLLAPRLSTLYLQPYIIDRSHLIALTTCLPALDILHIDSEIFDIETSEEFSMPFSRLTALHVTLNLNAYQAETHYIPLLKDCLSLQIISIDHLNGTNSGSIVLPRSCATRFAFSKYEISDEQWLKRDIFDSLPNLRHLRLEDYPSESWYKDSDFNLGSIQSGNGQIIDYLVDGACPLLESVKLKDFSVHSDVLWNLINARPSLKLSYSRCSFASELTVPRNQKSWRELGSYDDPKTFFSPWVASTSDEEEDEDAW